jgi:hypothetical protein
VGGEGNGQREHSKIANRISHPITTNANGETSAKSAFAVLKTHAFSFTLLQEQPDQIFLF